MEELLTPVSTAYKASHLKRKDALIEAHGPSMANTTSPLVSTPEEALKALRAEPDIVTLRIILKYLVYDSPSSGFRISHSSPIAAQLVNALVSDVLPNYWPTFNEAVDGESPKSLNYAQERKLFLLCLRSITGLNAVLSRLKTLVLQIKEDRKQENGLKLNKTLEDFMDVLEALLSGENFITHIWNSVEGCSSTQRKAFWHETVTLIGGGKLLNSAAEYSSFINEASCQISKARWVADGIKYSRWLSRNIIQWSKKLPATPQGPWKHLSNLLSRSLHLGYPDIVLYEILELLLGADDERSLFRLIIENLPVYEQRTVIFSSLRLLSNRYISQSIVMDEPDWWKTDSKLISAAAGYLNHVISGHDSRKEHLITWLTSLSGAGVGDVIGIRRTAVAVFSESKDDIETVVEKTLHHFGDELYVRHTPTLQQEVHAQVLLLSAGYLHRLAPVKLAILLRSSAYLTAISNHLAASTARARFLGMVVGEALSSLVDQPDKRMKFKLDELESPEAKWYKSLTHVRDSVGRVDLLKPGIVAKPHVKQKPQRSNIRPGDTQPRGQSKIISIEELSDTSSRSEDDGLAPYAKPDSDPEDSDEDPTVVQRNKPTAPVYIRDLIVYLRDTENFDRQRLALSTAPTLIRRKSGFGTEVGDHVEELAALLVGIQDKFNLENFQDMRLQGMIAVLLSQPSKMGQWFAKTFFEGDYSLSQRASILTVLSVAARELAGFKEEDASLTTVNAFPSNSFPSKLLPPGLHKIYATAEQKMLSQGPIDDISQKLSNTMIQPLAASVADKATGPDILKVRTFSSRLAVESRRKPPSANKLSAVVANSFFFPLTGRFFVHYKAYGGKNIIFEPFLLSSFLKTLGLVLHASGTSTPQLPQMTMEMWDLLLSFRTDGESDKSIGQAVLFGFMTLLEVNEDKRRFVEEHGKELLETRKWVEIFFAKLGSGSEEDDKIRTLAAGVLFRIQEVVEKYEALLVGQLLSY